MNIRRTVTLNNGVSMPTLGLGVWQMREGEETENAVRWALDAGYRLIDTAKLYGNERSVGKAIRESGIPREEVFVTTKFWPTDLTGVKAAFERSFTKLDLGYIDLYLIHFPNVVPGLGKSIRGHTWSGFEKLYESKRVRSIGISNFGVNQIKELLASCSVRPSVNQVQFNPFSYDKELLEFCASENIVVEAYSPLMRGRHLNHASLVGIAQGNHKSPAQVIIRWALQHQTVVIPKSSHRGRIAENSNVFDFELSAKEMKTIDSLAVNYRRHK
jgi:diketogulonate reductase-like aldo/keto reductase